MSVGWSVGWSVTFTGVLAPAGHGQVSEPDSFADQMLCLAGHVATVLKGGGSVVIPNVFITKVDQTNLDKDDGSPEVKTLTSESVVPLGDVFDTEALLDSVRDLGGTATLGNAVGAGDVLLCSPDAGLTSNPEAVLVVLKAMQPSAQLLELLHKVQTSPLYPQAGKGKGVCVHHPDAAEQTARCNHWRLRGALNLDCDGLRPISEVVEHRTSHLPGRWIFYQGGHEAIVELQSTKISVVTREEVCPGGSRRACLSSGTPMPSELDAALDFFLCSSLPHFVGDSASTWSAIQIARRNSEATWYNWPFIPLASFLRTYPVPIVYTYTEQSTDLGQTMLKISLMATLKRVRPASLVHVLYHGTQDSKFQQWLAEHGVTVHAHSPSWDSEAERLRQAGLRGTSFERHRFLSSGNYLGTWQRLDVPLHLSTEYCFLLDSDAFVFRQPFFHDLGADITSSLAFSSDLDQRVQTPGDSGIMLMNVPFMRETLEGFRSFVFNRSEPTFNKSAAHHGAYLDFYGSNVTFLPQKFSMKAVYQSHLSNAFMLHFHGLKPHDLIRWWFTGKCDPPKCFLLVDKAQGAPWLCATVQAWAREAAKLQSSLLRNYCRDVVPEHSKVCVELFKALMAMRDPADKCVERIKKIISRAGQDLSHFEWLFGR